MRITFDLLGFKWDFPQSVNCDGYSMSFTKFDGGTLDAVYQSNEMFELELRIKEFDGGFIGCLDRQMSDDDDRIRHLDWDGNEE